MNCHYKAQRYSSVQRVMSIKLLAVVDNVRDKLRYDFKVSSQSRKFEFNVFIIIRLNGDNF